MPDTHYKISSPNRKCSKFTNIQQRIQLIIYLPRRGGRGGTTGILMTSKIFPPRKEL